MWGKGLYIMTIPEQVPCTIFPTSGLCSPSVGGIIMSNRGAGAGRGGGAWLVVTLHSRSASDSPESGGAERESGAQSQALTG